MRMRNNVDDQLPLSGYLPIEDRVLMGTSMFRRARQSACLILIAMIPANELVFPAVLAEDPTKVESKAASNPFEADPVHQAGLQASGSHKIVFVLGEGFDEQFSLVALKEDLQKLGLIERKHFDFLKGASTPKKSGVIYVGREVVRAQSNNQPLIFSQDATEDAVLAIKGLMNRGYITVAK